MFVKFLQNMRANPAFNFQVRYRIKNVAEDFLTCFLNMICVQKKMFLIVKILP